MRCRNGPGARETYLFMTQHSSTRWPTGQRRGHSKARPAHWGNTLTAANTCAGTAPAAPAVIPISDARGRRRHPRAVCAPRDVPGLAQVRTDEAGHRPRVGLRHAFQVAQHERGALRRRVSC